MKQKKNYEKALEIDPNFVNALTNYGNLFFELNSYDEAIKKFKKAIEIDNQTVQAYYNLGLVYQSIGEFQAALENFEKVLKLDPNNTNADKIISRLTKYSKEHPHIKKMEEKLNKFKLNDFQKSHLCFSLGKAYEDFADYDNSFKYLKLGNNFKRSIIQYDLKDDVKTFKNLKEFFKEYQFKPNSNDLNGKKIIFIVGLPRSGTSLVEQIISTHSKVYGCGELDYMTRIISKNFFGEKILNTIKLKNLDKTTIEKLKIEYFNFLEKFSPHSSIYTDKAPLNFIWIGIIKILIPNSKIIHCKRNPKDNILSLYKNDFDDRLNFSYDFKDLVEFYKEYLDLTDLWKEKLNDQIYDATYENIISNPETEIENLLKFCELNFEKECLNFHNNKRPIKTVSAVQARQPLYNKSISSYKNFEKHMQSVFKEIDEIQKKRPQ